MNHHYLIVADESHLRIYAADKPDGGHRPSLSLVKAMDFAGAGAGRPAGKRRRPDLRAPRGRVPLDGEMVDVRLGLESDREPRRARDLATVLNTFLLTQRDAIWDFAAAPGLLDAVLDRLLPDTLKRLHASLSKNLANRSSDAVRHQFASIDSPAAAA